MREPFWVDGPEVPGALSGTANAPPDSPLVVEIPHAGVYVDPASLANMVARAASIARDADLHVDALYAGAAALGAHVLASRVSRYVVDLNRAEQDVDPGAVVGAPRDTRATRGLVWRLTSDGDEVLARPISRAELERRLEWLYRPYHARLADLIAAKRQRFGFAIVLAAHSMPSVGRAGHPDHSRARADVVPGTRGRTSAAGSVIDVVDRVAAAHGLTVAHDDPYKGGFTTQHYGQPRSGVHVVQVEVARRLYMDEATLAVDPPRFARLRRFCDDLVAALASARP
jgi:N-formylglutamate amidohydrolase